MPSTSAGPATPNDQAWVESFFGHLKGEKPHLEKIRDPTTTPRDSIEAHLTTVFAALAVTRWVEDTTGWSVKRFIKTVRRYRLRAHGTMNDVDGRHPPVSSPRARMQI